MRTILIVLLSCCSVFGSGWTIHGFIGTNPWIGFSRYASDCSTVELIGFQYGVNSDFTTNQDAWLRTDNTETVSHWGELATNGPVLQVDESWGTIELLPTVCPTGVSASSINWFIEDGAPDFLGGSSVVGPPIPGEYWVDWDSFGTIRIRGIQPGDFGKYLHDGSINPNYVTPLVKDKGHKKH